MPVLLLEGVIGIAEALPIPPGHLILMPDMPCYRFYQNILSGFSCRLDDEDEGGIFLIIQP